MLVETVLQRRRAAAKLSELPGTDQWLFTDEALQQASAAPVALHRSKRLSGRMVHDVTCSIGTELAALRGAAAQVLGSDIDPVRLAMARHNLREAVDTYVAPMRCARSPATRWWSPTRRDAAVVGDGSIHAITSPLSTS